MTPEIQAYIDAAIEEKMPRVWVTDDNWNAAGTISGIPVLAKKGDYVIDKNRDVLLITGTTIAPGVYQVKDCRNV